MDVAVNTRTIGLLGSSASADRIAEGLTGLGANVRRLAAARFAGRPSRRNGPDAVILVSDDVDDAAALRRRWKSAPIIAVCDDIELKTRALRLCADDAVSSDVTIEELEMRVAAAIRRALPASDRFEQAPKTIGEFHLDEDRQSLVVRDQRIRLTPRQVSIMSVLRRHVEHNPIPLARIYQAVCSMDTRLPNHETIRVHISMLNKKLASVSGAGVRIRCGQDGYYVQAAA